MKTLYHGSKNIIQAPIFGKGRIYNDYGLGFYCTGELSLAKEWGVDLNRDGYANIYLLDDENLSILDLNDENYVILHWLGILLKNREFDTPSPLAAEAKEYIIRQFSVNYQDFDIIVGYRADDSYFSFAQDFINGTISYRQLCKAMFLGKLGIQTVVKSRRAFKALEFIGYEIAEYSEWYEKKIKRDQKARREYFDFERNKRERGDIYITQILDEEMNENDPRLR